MRLFRKKRNCSQFAGFTMVELIMVMAIVGVLGGLFVTTFPASQRRARDARRRSDIKQYQAALEVYANANDGIYPKRTAASGARASTTLCGDLSLVNCPEEPRNTNYYRYQSDTNGLDYLLWAQLEEPQSPTNYFITCSNGLTGEKNSGIPPTTAGSCPL